MAEIPTEPLTQRAALARAAVPPQSRSATCTCASCFATTSGAAAAPRTFEAGGAVPRLLQESIVTDETMRLLLGAGRAVAACPSGARR